MHAMTKFRNLKFNFVFSWRKDRGNSLPTGIIAGNERKFGKSSTVYGVEEDPNASN